MPTTSRTEIVRRLVLTTIFSGLAVSSLIFCVLDGVWMKRMVPGMYGIEVGLLYHCFYYGGERESHCVAGIPSVAWGVVLCLMMVTILLVACCVVGLILSMRSNVTRMKYKRLIKLLLFICNILISIAIVIHPMGFVSPLIGGGIYVYPLDAEIGYTYYFMFMALLCLVFAQLSGGKIVPPRLN